MPSQAGAMRAALAILPLLTLLGCAGGDDLTTQAQNLCRQQTAQMGTPILDACVEQALRDLRTQRSP
jgi:hypothetical protein